MYYLWIISGLSISADLLQQRCSSGPAVAGTTATGHCSNSNNCHCCYPKRDQTGTKLLPMLPLILEHGSDSSSSAVCSGQVTTRSRPTSMVIAGKQIMRVRVDMVGMIRDDLLTQWRHIPIGQFRANIFWYKLLPTNYGPQKFLKVNYFHLPIHLANEL